MRYAETSEPIPCPSLRPRARVAGSNPGAAVRPSGLLAPRMLWPLDCFVARAPRNDGWLAADPIASVVVGRRLNRDPLYFVERKLVAGSVVELGGARTFLRRHGLRVFERAVVGQKVSIARRQRAVPSGRLAVRDNDLQTSRGPSEP